MKNLIESVKKILKQRKKLKNEATTTGNIAGYQTPFAFSRRGLKGNTKAANQLGFKMVDINEEYDDEYDLNKNDEIDPGDAVIAARNEKGREKTEPKKSKEYGKKRKKINKILRSKKINEGLKSSIYNLKNEEQTEFESTDVDKESTDTTPVNVEDIYLNFQKKLNDSSEELKDSLQSSLLEKLLGKKVTARSSKGIGQAISDYTFSITGIDIDFYNNKYYIVLVGKEEGKSKTTRFLLQPFYKIKSYGLSKSLKPSDLERIKRYRKLIKGASSSPDDQEVSKTNVTRDEIPSKPTRPTEQPKQQPSVDRPNLKQQNSQPKPTLDKTRSQQSI